MTVEVPERPLLGPWYRAARTADGVVLEWADRALVFSGNGARTLLPELLPLLDGRHTVEEIVAELGAGAGAAVRAALAELAGRGVLLPGPPLCEPGGPGETALLLAALEEGESPRSVLDILGRRRVLVAGGGVEAEEIRRLVERSGLACGPPVSLSEACGADWGDLLVAAPGSRELRELEPLNERALRDGLPWLQVLPFDGRHAAIGPLFVPGETCCRRCYLLRRASVCGYADEFWPLQDVAASRPAPPVLAALTGAVAVLLALRWLVRRDPMATGVTLALELAPRPTVTTHVVYPVPRCPACTQARARPLPWLETAAS